MLGIAGLSKGCFCYKGSEGLGQCLMGCGLLCRVGALPAAVATLSDLEDLHIRGELPIDEDDDQVCVFLFHSKLACVPSSVCLASFLLGYRLIARTTCWRSSETM